jgi:hypothetical protein
MRPRFMLNSPSGRWRRAGMDDTRPTAAAVPPKAAGDQGGMIMKLRLALLAAIAAASLGGAQAQSSAERRAAELAEVATRLNDPDPMLRIAFYEEVLESGDRRMIQMATTIAMRSDDRNLRGLAMLGHLARMQRVDFQLTYPGDLEKQFQRANDDGTLRKFFNDVAGGVSRNIYDAGRMLTIGFELDDDFLGGKVYALSGNSRYEGDLKVNADRVSMFFPRMVLGGSTADGCRLTVEPTAEGLIEGPFVCGPLSYPARAEVR